MGNVQPLARRVLERLDFSSSACVRSFGGDLRKQSFALYHMLFRKYKYSVVGSLKSYPEGTDWG